MVFNQLFYPERNKHFSLEHLNSELEAVLEGISQRPRWALQERSAGYDSQSPPVWPALCELGHSPGFTHVITIVSLPIL